MAWNSPAKENIPVMIVHGDNPQACDNCSQSTTRVDLLGRNKISKLQELLGLTNDRNKFLSIKVSYFIFA